MRDFLFEDKGCTMICCWGCASMTEFDALRSVLFALEAIAAMASLKEDCRIGISSGKCFSGIHGHLSRRDFVVMGTEVNMAARLVGHAPSGTALCSEAVYEATKEQIGFDMSNPLTLKGRSGKQRALCPYGKVKNFCRGKKYAVEACTNIFVGRVEELYQLQAAAQAVSEGGNGAAFILEGLAGMGKSSIVQQFQRDAVGFRFLFGSGSSLEKDSLYAVAELMCDAANLSPSPTYGEIVALKYRCDLNDDDIHALGLVLPALCPSDMEANGLPQDAARAAQVCLKILQLIEKAVFVLEDAHWIDDKSWVFMQMILPTLLTTSIVIIVKRPHTINFRHFQGLEQITEVKEVEDENDLWKEDVSVTDTCRDSKFVPTYCCIWSSY